MSDYAVAASNLGRTAAMKPAEKPRKGFHVQELHDKTYHVTMHHGDMKPSTEGSAPDLDAVIDQLHDHMLGKPMGVSEEKKESPAEKKAEAE